MAQKKTLITKNGYILAMSNTQLNFYPNWIKRNSAVYYNSILTSLSMDKTREYSKKDMWKMEHELLRSGIQARGGSDIGNFETTDFQCARDSYHSKTTPTEQPQQITAQADTVDKLQIWINECLKAGHQPKLLIESLLKAGHQKTVISKYFDLKKFGF